MSGPASPAPTTGLSGARARFVLRSLGPVGWTGLLALLAAAAGVAIVGPRLDRSNERAAQDIQALESQWAQARDPKLARAQRDPVGAFVASLPASSQVPEFVAAMQRRADQGAVEIDRTEYRVQAVLDHSVERYRLSFPAHVDYPHLRAWLDALLHDYPSLILDEIALRRAVDGGEELEAHVSLSFLAREGE